MMVIKLLRINFANIKYRSTMKNIFLTLLIVSIVKFSFAQEKTDYSKFQGGLKFSTNIGWINAVSNNISGEGARLSISYGVMADYFFAENYALAFELLSSSYRGAIKLNEAQAFTHESFNNPKPSSQNLILNYNTQYVELPISLKFRTKEIGYIRYWGQFGLNPGVLVGSRVGLGGDVPEEVKQVVGYDGYRTNHSEGDVFATDKFDDKVFLIRSGVIIGGGIEYSLAGNARLYGGLRYDNGFINMFLKDKNSNALNNAISLSVGIMF